MTVPYGVFCYVLPFNKCSVGRGALTPPQLCFIAIYKSATNLTPFVGDDACIVPHVGPCLISPTSNSAARLNFHHHKKHMPAHSAPGICFFCYRTIGNTAQFPPCGLSTAPAAAAPRSPYRHLELCGIAYKLIPPAPSDNNTPPTNPRRPHSFSCPGSGHTRAENRYTPCCLPL